MEELATRFVDSLVGMSSEKVALSLQQIGRQTLAAIAVVERERRRKGGRWHAVANGVNHRFTPGLLIFVQRFGEEVVRQQVRQLRIRIVSFFDLSRKRLRIIQPPR